MNNYSLDNPLKISPEEFLSAFFAPHEKICFRIFSDKPDSAFAGMKFAKEYIKFEKIVDILVEHNQAGRGIYFVINHGGHEDSEITRINAQFMECDDIPLEDQHAKIQEFPLEPSLIVKTRKSLHCYWLIKNTGEAKSNFRRIQRGLVAHFNADPACVNESRVFRLPGFYHCKEDPVMVEVIKFSPHIRYSQDELAKHLPEVPDEPIPITTFESSPIRDVGNQKGVKLVGYRCPFMKHCKTNAKTLPEPLWYAMITNLAVFEGGAEAIHKLSKPYPKYSREQTEAKIAHYIKSDTKPMSCEKLSQLGFTCPKLKSCHVKSPAGLAFRALEIADIRKLLAKCTVKHNPTDDVATARTFILWYLYNFDSGLAETFINSEIKAHFNFKVADLKQLVTYQKDLYRDFSSTQEARQQRRGNEIPAWYEVSEKGNWRFLPSVLADHLAENANVIYCADEYYFYDGGVYLPKKELAAMKYVKSYMNRRYASTFDIKDAEYQWRIEAFRTVREINVNTYIMNFHNGLYNLLTNEFTPHNPKVLSTIRLGGNYDPNAECPMFMDYLKYVLPESEFPLIQEILGYMLVPINKAQKAFVIVGRPHTGKSTILNIVREILLGGEYVSSLTWQALDEKFATVQLFGKLANIFADLPSQNIRDTGTFKAITGEDYITAQHKFKEAFSFKPFARLLFSCNNIPKNYGDRSDGFFRRLIIIRFDRTVTQEKKDPNFMEKLSLEADGILAWALVGLKRLMANNYAFSETDRTREELSQYKTESSSVLSFVDEICVLEPDAIFLREELFAAYQEYCSTNSMKGASKIQFNGDLDVMNGVSRCRDPITGRRAWRGIRLSD